jgi:hypothetical protein
MFLTTHQEGIFAVHHRPPVSGQSSEMRQSPRHDRGRGLCDQKREPGFQYGWVDRGSYLGVNGIPAASHVGKNKVLMNQAVKALRPDRGARLLSRLRRG